MDIGEVETSAGTTSLVLPATRYRQLHRRGCRPGTQGSPPLESHHAWHPGGISSRSAVRRWEPRRRRGGRPPGRIHELVGSICSAGFASGDRIIVGYWIDSPVGPMTDVMWARPDGERVLLAASSPAADFITAVYRFDRVEVVPFVASFDGRHLDLEAGELALRMRGGRAWRFPLGGVRPAWFTRWVEGAVAAPLLGVHTYGVSPTGVREWYRADEYRPVVHAQASFAGVDAGALRRLDHPGRFGFSEPPRRPAMVAVRPRLQDPSGRLDEVLAGLSGG